MNDDKARDKILLIYIVRVWVVAAWMLVLAAQRRLTYCADMIFFYGIIIRDDILYIQSSRGEGVGVKVP